MAVDGNYITLRDISETNNMLITMLLYFNRFNINDPITTLMSIVNLSPITISDYYAIFDTVLNIFRVGNITNILAIDASLRLDATITPSSQIGYYFRNLAGTHGVVPSDATSLSLTILENDSPWILVAPALNSCPSGYFGTECDPCPCVAGLCNDGLNGDGSCTCKVGSKGPFCEECIPRYYGQNCELCACYIIGTNSCNDGIYGNGTCNCAPNFIGTHCDQCLPGYYGESCDMKCNCLNPNIMCLDGIKGNGTCVCKPGYSGTNCSTILTEDNDSSGKYLDQYIYSSIFIYIF